MFFRRQLRTAALGLLALAIVAGCSGDKPQGFVTSDDAAPYYTSLEAARTAVADSRPILVDFMADW